MSQGPPPIPFDIEMSDAIRDFIAEEMAFDPAFAWRWQSIIEVLEVSGDRVGTPIAGGPRARGYEFHVGNWALKVVWRYENGRVRILGAKYRN